MRTPTDSSIGKRIRALRTLKQITMSDLAIKSRIGMDHLSKIEVGSRGISIPTLMSIAKALSTSTDYLLGLSDMPTSPEDATLKEVIIILRGQKPENKAIMLSTLRSLDKSLS